MSWGRYAFLGGLVIAVASAFMNLGGFAPLILVVLGVVVGFLNIKSGESTPFLLGVIGLALVTGILSAIPGLQMLAPVLANVAVMAGAAGGVVALKTVYEKASN